MADFYVLKFLIIIVRDLIDILESHRGIHFPLPAQPLYSATS